MPIVAVNGGGNTPQGVNDGDVDGRDFLVWQRQYGTSETGGLQDGTSNTFLFGDVDAAVDPVGDTAMFTITVSTDGSTASTPPVSEITPVKPVDTPAPSVSDTDGFVFADYKPTESLRADDNFLIINWLAEDHFKVDPSDPSVDPANPNVEWPIGPIPEVQDDGLLLPY